jgi:hypothetical protein
MLVASRDPFHGTHDVPPAPRAGGHIARTMSVLQIVGTVLAIPVGLGSAYSMYKNNFTAEASCQALRANIILILDKSVDASARHMLVRRDVEAFEKTCGGVDPDAAAAFKGLLAADKTSIAAAPRRIEMQPKVAETKPAEVKAAAKTVEAKTVETKSVEAKTAEAKTAEAKPVERRIETKVEAAAKLPVVKSTAPVAAVAVAAPLQRDAATSDTEWLDAVRGALKAPPADAEAANSAEANSDIKTDIKTADTKAAEAKAAEAKAAIVAPLVRQAVREAPPMSIENVRTPPLMTVLAPTLPPPSSVNSVPGPRVEPGVEPRLETVRADNHPVPPGAIPDPPPTDITPEEDRSRIGQLIAHIPLVNRVFDK